MTIVDDSLNYQFKSSLLKELKELNVNLKNIEYAIECLTEKTR